MDSISIHEAKGRGKGTKKSREVIKLEAVFHSGPRVRIATCQSVTLHEPRCLLGWQPPNTQGRRTAVHEHLRFRLVRSGNSAIGLP
jgi:hypothetical protein